MRTTKHGGVATDQMAYMPCRGCDIGKVHSRLIQLSPKKLKTVRLGKAMTGTVA